PGEVIVDGAAGVPVSEKSLRVGEEGAGLDDAAGVLTFGHAEESEGGQAVGGDRFALEGRDPCVEAWAPGMDGRLRIENCRLRIGDWRGGRQGRCGTGACERGGSSGNCLVWLEEPITSVCRFGRGV